MSKAMPKFFISEYFVPEIDNWHLKANSPDDLKKEFEEYMKEKDYIIVERDVTKYEKD